MTNEILTYGITYWHKIIQKSSNQVYVTTGKLRSLKGAQHMVIIHTLILHIEVSKSLHGCKRKKTMASRKLNSSWEEINAWATLRGVKLWYSNNYIMEVWNIYNIHEQEKSNTWMKEANIALLNLQSPLSFSFPFFSASFPLSLSLSVCVC